MKYIARIDSEDLCSIDEEIGVVKILEPEFKNVKECLKAIWEAGYSNQDFNIEEL